MISVYGAARARCARRRSDVLSGRVAAVEDERLTDEVPMAPGEPRAEAWRPVFGL